MIKVISQLNSPLVYFSPNEKRLIQIMVEIIGGKSKAVNGALSYWTSPIYITPLIFSQAHGICALNTQYSCNRQQTMIYLPEQCAGINIDTSGNTINIYGDEINI